MLDTEIFNNAFTDLKSNDNTLQVMSESDIAKIPDWYPTMIPMYDKVLLGGIPAGGRITEIFGDPNVGKAASLDTRIPTPKGDIKMGDVKVGDHIFSRKGKPTKVLGVFPQGKLDVYLLTLQDGRTIKVSAEHIWSVYTSRGNLKDITTQEMMDKGLQHGETNRYRYSIPLNDAVEYNPTPVSVDPYLLGAMLGDGCLTERQLTLSSDDQHVIDKVTNILGATEAVKKSQSYSYTFGLPIQEGNKTRFQTKEVLGDILDIPCKTFGKFIPDEYLTASIENRIKLAQGLFDTDGSVEGKENGASHISLVSVNERLAKQVVQLVRSLGYKATLSSYDHKDKENKEYIVRVISTKDKLSKLFTLPRQLDKLSSREETTRYTDRVNIISIEKLPEQEEMQCLYVDNEEHLFLAGDYIVTHNSTLSALIMGNAQKMGAIPVMYDVEATTSKERLVELGVDVARMITKEPKVIKKNGKPTIVDPLTIEDIMASMIEISSMINEKLPNNPVLFLWDTVAITQPRKTAELELGGVEQPASQAKSLTQGLRKLTANLERNNSALIALNQVRADIGGNPMYPEKKTVGGDAWQHAMSLRIYLQGKAKVKATQSDTTPIGKNVQVKFIKSKIGDNVADTAVGVLLYEHAFDIYYNTMLNAIDLGIIKQGGAYLTYVDANGEVIKDYKKNWRDIIADPERADMFNEIWQKVIKAEFPTCFPPLFNLNAVMTGEEFPMIEGLREYYADIQAGLPEEQQHVMYKQYMEQQG